MKKCIIALTLLPFVALARPAVAEETVYIDPQRLDASKDLLEQPKADLIVKSLVFGRPFTIAGSNALPVTLEIANIGNADAGRFKSSFLYVQKWMKRNAVVRFIPALSTQNPQGWYLWTDGLKAGETRKFSGYVHFNSRVSGRVYVWAKVDSTDGDEFVPAYGRVREANELNNQGGRKLFRLRPVYQGGDVLTN